MGGYVASPGGVMTLPLLLVLLQAAQASPPVGSVPSWTLHFNGDIRWQQITPAGALLVSSDGGLAGVDVERGQIAWQKPELGGLPVDSVRMVEGSLLMEAPKRGGLGGLMQGLVRMASGATTLEVLQAGPEVIVVNTLMGLRALDAKRGAVRWSATLPTARAGNPAKHVRLFP